MELELASTVNDFVKFHGPALARELERNYEQRKCGIPYRLVFAKYARKAQSMAVPLSDLSFAFEQAGFIRVILSPAGGKHVYAMPLPKSEDDLFMELADHDREQFHSAKEARRERAIAKRQEG